MSFLELRTSPMVVVLCGGQKHSGTFVFGLDAPFGEIVDPPLQPAFCFFLKLVHKFVNFSSDCSKEFWMLPCTPSENPSYFLQKATTLNECMLMCHKSPRCKGFDWLPNVQKCWVMKVQTVQNFTSGSLAN